MRSLPRRRPTSSEAWPCWARSRRRTSWPWPTRAMAVCSAAGERCPRPGSTSSGPWRSSSGWAPCASRSGGGEAWRGSGRRRHGTDFHGGSLMTNRKPINRRSFLGQAGAVAIGAGALGGTALSYGRILGANDRISLGHVGVGRRGTELGEIVARLKAKNVEMTAVCDLWKVNREAAVGRAASAYGRAPRAFQYMQDLLALKDVDAVLVSTADFQHATHLKLVAEAGKDCYCEKPMANDLAEAKAAREAVLSKPLIVQVGTQHRSEPYQNAAHDFIKTGALGDVTKAEIVWNYHGPRWRGRPEVSQLKEQDTDWRRWLLGKPFRPIVPDD